MRNKIKFSWIVVGVANIIFSVTSLIGFAHSVERAPRILGEPEIGKSVSPTILNYLDSILGQKRISGVAKPILIDFWAAWCTPCLKAMPSLDSISASNREKLGVISVTNETLSQANNILSKILPGKKLSMKLITNDRILNAYFPHQYIPHLLWIDEKGIYRGLIKEVDEQTISSIINHKTDAVRLKPKLLEWNPLKPLYSSGQASFASADELRYHSLIAKGREDLSGVHGNRRNYIISTNTSILKLYQYGFGKFNPEFLDESRCIVKGLTTSLDSAKMGFISNKQSLLLRRTLRPNYTYTYELVVPDSSFSVDEKFIIMQQDLNRYFSFAGIEGGLEKRKETVFSLEYISKHDSSAFSYDGPSERVYHTENYLKIKGSPMKMLIVYIRQMLPFQTISMVDQTGYTRKVRMELNLKEVSIDGLNEKLKAYNLVLKKRKLLVDYLSISVDPIRFKNL